MKLLLIALISFCSFTFAEAQDLTLAGTVTKGGDGEPLSFVNIGIRNKNVGTASDEKGKFVLKLAKEHLQDVLTFSAIGYEELSVPVRDLVESQPLKVVLKEKVTALQEVVVKSRKMKVKKLGVTGRMPGVWGLPDKREGRDIYEFVNFISIKEKPAEVLSVHFYLASPSIDSARFRINFYKNKNGFPGERLVEKSIIQRLPTKNGWVSIDVKEHDIYLNEDFFIGFEYLPAAGFDRLAIAMGGKVGGSVYTRKTSLGAWEKISGVSLSGYVTARQ